MSEEGRVEALLNEAVGAVCDSPESTSDPRVLGILEEAASLGSDEAEFLCGVMLMYGGGIGCMDPERASAYFRRAADAGNPDALYELGIGLETAGAPRPEVIETYLKGAQRGHLPCVLGLRAQYRESESDREEYLHWTGVGAELGDPEAQYELGVRYGTGDGVPQDLTEAVGWYERASAQNLPEACHNLAVFYATGQGVERDLEVAARWYARACELGAAKACRTLAAMFYHGQGVRRDRSRAERLMTRAERLDEESRRTVDWTAHGVDARRAAKLTAYFAAARARRSS